jgi:hypothetical protein
VPILRSSSARGPGVFLNRFVQIVGGRGSRAAAMAFVHEAAACAVLHRHRLVRRRLPAVVLGTVLPYRRRPSLRHHRVPEISWFCYPAFLEQDAGSLATAPMSSALR